MKKILTRTMLLALLLPFVVSAQKTELQIGDTSYYKTLIPETKQGLLKNMSMIANMNFAMRNEFIDGTFDETRFRMDQFRLEIRGQVTDKVYFRFRDRYTRAQTSESVDNLSRSVDMAYIRVNLSDTWTLSAGKMCADWGAWEFDWNPIDIYEYSDIVEYADNFLTGVGASYTPNKQHQFTVQVLDSRTKTFGELYGAQPNYEESKVPLAFVVNWRGRLFDGKFNTIYSYSLFNEAQSNGLTADVGPANMNYVALGNELKLGKFGFIYDFKWSDEALDRTSIVSSTIPDSINGQYLPYAASNTEYIGHWIHVSYRVHPKVNLVFIGMLDIARWKNAPKVDAIPNPTGETKIRDAWGYIPTVEFYPWDDLNFKFFVNWVGRAYNYTDYAKSSLGANDYTTGRFCLGFVTPLAIF